MLEEVLKQEPDIKDPIQEEEPDIEIEDFLNRWRNSEFYPWVMKAFNNELSVNEVQEQMEVRYANGEQMTNDEIGEATRADFIGRKRVERLKDVLT